MSGIYTLIATAEEIITVDCRKVMRDDELIIDTFTPLVTTGAGITISSITVGAVENTIGSVIVPAYEWLSFFIVTTIAGVYTFEIVFKTDSTPARRVVKRIQLTVEA